MLYILEVFVCIFAFVVCFFIVNLSFLVCVHVIPLAYILWITRQVTVFVRTEFIVRN